MHPAVRSKLEAVKAESYWNRYSRTGERVFDVLASLDAQLEDRTQTTSLYKKLERERERIVKVDALKNLGWQQRIGQCLVNLDTIPAETCFFRLSTPAAPSPFGSRCVLRTTLECVFRVEFPVCAATASSPLLYANEVIHDLTSATISDPWSVETSKGPAPVSAPASAIQRLFDPLPVFLLKLAILQCFRMNQTAMCGALLDAKDAKPTIEEDGKKYFWDGTLVFDMFVFLPPPPPPSDNETLQ